MPAKSLGRLCLLTIRALVVGYVILFSIANAAPGDFDSLFGVGGKVTTNIATRVDSDFSFGSLKQPDGKLLTLGHCTAVESYELPCIARFTSAGVLDNTFGVGGVVRIEFIAGSGGGFRTAIIDGNRIVAAGFCSVASGIARLCLARMHLDGTLDMSFGNAGKLVLAPVKTFDIAFALAVDASGKYLVGGNCQDGAIWHACVVRVDANGVLDASFNGTGMLTTLLGFYRTQVGDIAIDGNKIVVAGTCETTIRASICVTRINADGSIDTGFNSSGTYVSGIGEAGDIGGRVQVYQSKLYVAGTCRQSEIRSSFCLFRLNDNGTLDTTFNGTGFVRTFILSQDSYAVGMSIQNDKIVVGGDCTTGGGEYFCWARYELNGQLDTSLKGTGYVTRYTSVSATGMVVDTDRVVLTGLCTYGVVIYRTCLQAFDASGNVLAGFGSSGFVDAYLSSASATDSASVIAATPDGKLLVAGYCESTLPSPKFCLARYLPTGELDVSFGGAGYLTSIPGLSATALTMDGDKIVVASVCGQAFCVTRLSADGSRDLSFNGGVTVTTPLPSCVVSVGISVLSLLIDNGNVLLNGACRESTDLYHRQILVRYLASGALDSSFNGNGMLVSVPELAVNSGLRSPSIELVAGKIIVAARSQYGNPDQLRIVRYNSDGTLDTAFGMTGSVVHSIGFRWLGTSAMTSHGTKIVLAGSCNPDSGSNISTSFFCVVRINADGTLDMSFNSIGYAMQKVGPLGGAPISLATHGDKLVLSGRCDSTLCIAVFNPDGSLDTTLAPAGSRVLTAAGFLEVGSGLIVANGKATIAGQCYGKYSADFCLTRIELPSPTFAAGVPSPPSIVSALPGDATATITFTSPVSNGGSPIVGYAATCEPGAISVTTTASPIVVNGLINGTNYTCRVAATNSVGTGALSDAYSVTPSKLALVAAYSRMPHGAASFDLPLQLTASAGGATVEPRFFSAYYPSILLVFNRAVSFVDSTSVFTDSGINVGGNINIIGGTGDTALLYFSQISAVRGRRVTINLNGVNGVLNTSLSLAFLAGDFDGSGVVDGADLRAVKNQAGKLAVATNFKFDINGSGSISAADVAAVKARNGQSLP